MFTAPNFGRTEYVLHNGRLTLQRVGRPRDFAIYEVRDTMPRAVALSAESTSLLWDAPFAGCNNKL